MRKLRDRNVKELVQGYTTSLGELGFELVGLASQFMCLTLGTSICILQLGKVRLREIK